jgi:transcription elongation factor GreA
MQKKEYLTKEKLEELKEELNFLKTEKRQSVAEHLEYARSLGDLSENAEYHDARAEQAEVESRINQLEEMVKNAVIVSPHHGDKVEIGSTVVVSKGKDGENAEYLIVGTEEADILLNKISFESPLGGSLLGKKKGDQIDLVTPKGKINYTIIDIK